MMNEESVYHEIGKFVSDRVDSGVITPVEWIITEFLQTRSDISGADAPLYKTCTRSHLQKIVKKVIGRYDVEARAETDPQLRLEGFEQLQRAYTVTREEKVLLVPIYKLTDDELLARAAEYDKMAKGCRDHAKELRGFVRSRRVEGAVA